MTLSSSSNRVVLNTSQRTDGDGEVRWPVTRTYHRYFRCWTDWTCNHSNPHPRAWNSDRVAEVVPSPMRFQVWTDSAHHESRVPVFERWFLEWSYESEMIKNFSRFALEHITLEHHVPKDLGVSIAKPMLCDACWTSCVWHSLKELFRTG